MLAHVLRFTSERDASDACASGGPRLDFNYNFVAQLLRRRDRFLDTGCGPTARDFESICRQNRFTLIFVKSGHDEMCRAILAKFPTHARMHYLTADGLVMPESALSNVARPQPCDQKPAGLDRQSLHQLRSL